MSELARVLMAAADVADAVAVPALPEEPEVETLRRQGEAMGPSHDCRTVWIGGADAPVPA